MTPAEIGTLIEVDPALSLKVLQLANSAMFSPASPVHSIERAILLLGLNTVRFLITGVAVLQMAQQMAENEILSPADFWASAFRGAVIAKFFAQQCDYSEPNEAYLAGLIREVGQIALIQCAYQTYLEVFRAAQAEDVELLVKEKQILGFTHADVGALLVIKWNLDEELAAVIAAYPCLSDYPDHHRPLLTALLSLADRLSRVQHFQYADFEMLLHSLDPRVCEELKACKRFDFQPAYLLSCWQEIEPLLKTRNPFV